MDGAGHFLAQHGRLDGVSRGSTHGEHAVALHEHGLRAVQSERVDDSAADGVIADQRERPDGDLPAELVGHHGEHAWDRLAASSPGRMGMGLPADPGQVLVHVGVCGGVGGGRTVPIDEVRIEIGDHYGIRGQLVVADPGRLDHQQVVAWNAGRDGTGGPDHEPVLPQLHVRVGAAREVGQLAEGDAVGPHRNNGAGGEVGSDSDHVGRVNPSGLDRGRDGVPQYVDIVAGHLQRPVRRQPGSGGRQHLVDYPMGVRVDR